jgi:CheY-like chemotaxis protein
VVDDNETNCQLVAGMFAGSHHQLHFGLSGEEAVSKASEIRPDIILMDIRMPGMDGREALLEIRKISGLELTPIVAVTASSLLAEENDLKDRFNGYVRKPFSKWELFIELAQFLPAETKPESETKIPSETVTSPAAAPELLAELNRLLAEEWPGLRDSGAINECKAFAQKLEALAMRWTCQPLQSYARGLMRHAEEYAVIELEKRLREFDALVKQLEPSAKG